MPTAAAQTNHLVPEGLYPIAEFRRIAGISKTTLWRVEHQEKSRLRRVRFGGKVFVRGSDGIAWLENRGRRIAAKS